VPGAGTPIRILPPLLVNQIAAGEVVERPASVVRELIDNALDAGATRVVVELEAGGIELVRVSDDGAGIGADQLELALSPHATSKIERTEDLDRISTLGFRGEALASIASVARVRIRSRTPEADGASRIDAHGSRIGPVRPDSGPVGTQVSVRNLFFNTPARRKFLRTPRTEEGHCVEAVRNLAMGRPGVGFALSADGRGVLDLPVGQSPAQRVLAVLGEELGEQMLVVNADEFDDARGMALWGMVGRPALARATNKAQHILLNGRPIRDRTIQHALREAYRGLIEPGRYPTAVLMLEMSPGGVDVNVHPAKAEVRFRDQSLVHTIVLRAVREALQGADLTTGFDPGRSGFAPRSPTAVLPGGGGVAPGGSIPAQRVVDAVRSIAPVGGELSYETLRAALEPIGRGAAPSGADAPDSPGSPPEPGRIEPKPEPGLEAPFPERGVLQVHNSYVVTQDEQGVVIVDQHALHERVMFEMLRARLDRGDLESQRLITPAVVEGTAGQIDRLAELEPLLGRLGIRVEPMGPGSLGVQAFPTILFDRGVDPVAFVRELLDAADRDDFTPGAEQTLHEVLDMMACKAAVKAGDRLTDPELEALLVLRERVERSSNCPHGRPTSIRLTIPQIERLFGRT